MENSKAIPQKMKNRNTNDPPIPLWGIYTKELKAVSQRGMCTPMFPEALLKIAKGRRDLGERNGNPLQCSCLENPRDGGAWWAAVYGVAQSQTRLKRLLSSSSSSSSSRRNLNVTHRWMNEENVVYVTDYTIQPYKGRKFWHMLPHGWTLRILC